MTSDKMPVILLVEDNPADVRLMLEILQEGGIPNEFHIAKDGEEALAFLEDVTKPRPDLIFLDLNLPKKDGREVLKAIKSDLEYKRIPVIVMTSSGDQREITSAYDNHANCFITKPVDLDDFMKLGAGLKEFWLRMVQLPV